MELSGLSALDAEIERLRPAEILAPDGAQPALAGAGRPGSGAGPAGSALALARTWHFDSAALGRLLD